MYRTQWSRRVSSRRGAGAPVYVYVMALQALHQFFQQPYSPPVTLALIALMAGIHFRPAGFLEDGLPHVSEICMNPALVVQERNWRRLLLSVLFHADDAHLIFNMVSFLWKGVHLERRHGSPRFAALVAAFALFSQALHVAAARLLSDVLAVHTPFYIECSVGFSGVLFALKTVMNADSPTHSSVYGFVLPTKYAAWAELLLIQLLVPEASFLGHLCGILAGLIYLHGPSFLPSSFRSSAVLSALAAPLLTLFPFLRNPRGRIWGSGQSGRAGIGGPAAVVGRGRRAGLGGREGPSREGSAAAGAGGVWRCPACTYDNPWQAVRCTMCEGPRPEGARETGGGWMHGGRGGDTTVSAPMFPEVEEEGQGSGREPQQPQHPRWRQGQLNADELRELRLQRFGNR
ncbi:hypothetical protein CLOM_g8783 [Closterium sp. NIES-68]|nr:hypothetical protein CLOM_g8783 [Closterium sp. NIES-68]GJP76181.1 hypothetical protein CLOP_g6552 [Closterium sp. NIES-67]